MQLSFKDAVCRHFHVSPAAYENQVIRRSLHSHAQKIWPLLEITGAKPVFSCRTLIAMAADTMTREDMIDVLDEYYKDFRPHAGFLVKQLNIGISSRKLLALHDEVRCSDKPTTARETPKPKPFSETFPQKS